MLKKLLPAALIACSSGAIAQAYPNKPVKFIVPFPAGGINDVLARIVADKLQAKWGRPIVIEQKTGAKFTYIPYKGGSDAIIGLASGQADAIFNGMLATYPHVKSGKLRALGVTTEKRVDAFPNAPAIGEVVPGFAAEHWYGLWGTPGTPKSIIDRVNKAVGVALQAPDLRERIIADGFTPAYSTPEEYRKRLEKDVARSKDVVMRCSICCGDRPP